MPDREKIIKAIECCVVNHTRCFDDKDKLCPYFTTKFYMCETELLKDALALLKEQEHRETFTVIDTKTGKEADEYEIALHEDWAKHLCYCDMEGWAIENDGTLLLVDECGRCAYADRERFKVVWND